MDDAEKKVLTQLAGFFYRGGICWLLNLKNFQPLPKKKNNLDTKKLANFRREGGEFSVLPKILFGNKVCQLIK